jgi:hypothetical protein
MLLGGQQEYAVDACFIDCPFAANPFRLSSGTETNAVDTFAEQVCGNRAGGYNIFMLRKIDDFGISHSGKCVFRPLEKLSS